MAMIEAPVLIETKGTNIAGQAFCTQSSLSVHSFTVDEANNVVANPDRSGDYRHHTDYEPNPWLLLDFGAPVRYDEILVFNRLHQPQRARTLVVDISIDGKGWHRIHTCDPEAPPFGGTDGNPLRIVTPGYETRFIRFQLQEPEFLHFVAVEVYRYDD